MGTTPITCVDCGTIRHAPNASKHLIKRCKDCQAEFNRVRALERYYARTGKKRKEKKKAEPKEKKEEKPVKRSGGWLDIGPREDKPKPAPDERSEAERAARAERVWAQFREWYEETYGPGSWENCPTTDDW